MKEDRDVSWMYLSDYMWLTMNLIPRWERPFKNNRPMSYHEEDEEDEEESNVEKSPVDDDTYLYCSQCWLLPK